MARQVQRLRSWARRVPGLRAASRRTLTVIRGSASARVLVKRVFAIDTAAPVPLDVASGKVLGQAGTETLPVTLIVILGADRLVLEKTATEVAQLQLLAAGFRPVFVTDTPAFAAVRRYGYPMELVLDQASFEANDAGQSSGTTWEEYVRERLALLFATYGATASVTLGAEGFNASARLVLDSLQPARSVQR